MPARELTNNALAQLPLRSMVALAARAARSVQATFDESNDSMHYDENGAVEAALVYAESFALGTGPVADILNEAEQRTSAVEAVADSIRGDTEHRQREAAASASCAALAAALAAGYRGEGLSETRNAKATADTAWRAIEHMRRAHANAEAAMDALEVEYKAILAQKPAQSA